MKSSSAVSAHIATFPPKTRKLLTELRILLRSTVPGAVETISYGIPTFKINGKNVIHFAGYKTHIGLYPGADAMGHFKKAMGRYKTSRGTVQLPIDTPLPKALIKRIVVFRLKQEQEQQRSRKSRMVR